MTLRGRKASTLFIFTTLAIDAIGLGIILPVLPDIIRRFIGDEAMISRIFGYFVALYALMQFLSSPLLGRLSDRYGRRPLLLLSLIGAAIDYAFMAFAPTLPLLFVGRIIAGISGASFTVAGAYIADISTDENRSANYGIIGAGFGLGFIIGPALGGLLSAYGPQAPFLAAAGFNLLNFLFGLFVLPESLPAEKRRPFTPDALNPFRSLKNVFLLKSIAPFIGAWIFVQMGSQVHPAVWTLYSRHRFGWSAKDVGISLAVVGILSVLSQGFLTGFIVRRFGEWKALRFGLFGEALAYFGFAIVTTGAGMYAVLILSSVCWAAHPTLQSLISREVSASEQGELQGSLMSLTSLMAVLTPLVCTELFSRFSRTDAPIYFPGAPYAYGGLGFFAALYLIHRQLRQKAPLHV